MSIRETTVIKTPETKVWTDAEFMALPDDGNRYELVKGELIRGFTDFEGVNYLIFREKVPEFPPDHSHIWYFLRGKKSKSLIQQGF